MRFKVKIDDNIKYVDLKKLTEKGYRFVVFQYCISFGITLSRFSSAIFLLNEEDFKKHKLKYNLITIFFGWWSLHGIQHSIISLKVNNKGGIDMTDDILLNITEDSFNEGEVELVKTNELFIKPNKSDTKAIKDVLVNAFNNNSLVRKVVVGLYINTEKGENPYYTVGILVDKDFDYYKMETTRLLYTRFAKYARFVFMDLTEQNEINAILEKQGEIIILRN